jgi:hypothetical protein
MELLHPSNFEGRKKMRRHRRSTDFFRQFCASISSGASAIVISQRVHGKYVSVPVGSYVLCISERRGFE